jgi:hypothetical protein
MFINPAPRMIIITGHNLYNTLTLKRVSTAKISPAIIKNSPTLKLLLMLHFIAINVTLYKKY